MSKVSAEIGRVAGAAFLMLAVAGCANSQNKETPVASAEKPAAVAPSLQVDLPYGFTRRGVEIRVNSVEFSGGQFLVGLSLHEIRGEAAEILTSTLMEARTVGGQAMPYAGYNRGAQKQPGPEIRLNADERVLVDLLFQLPPNFEPGTPVQIEFGTGKWWKS